MRQTSIIETGPNDRSKRVKPEKRKHILHCCPTHISQLFKCILIEWEGFSGFVCTPNGFPLCKSALWGLPEYRKLARTQGVFICEDLFQPWLQRGGSSGARLTPHAQMCEGKKLNDKTCRLIYNEVQRGAALLFHSNSNVARIPI